MMQKSLVSCAVLTCSRQNLWNRNKENSTESTSVVPAKYPPKVKLERISTTLKCQSWKNYAYLGLWGIWGFYSGIELTSVSWWKRYFLVEKILFSASYIMGFFPCRDSSDYGWAWDARHFHIRFLGEHLGHIGATWLCYPSPLRSFVSLESIQYEESIPLTWVRPLQRVHLSLCLSVRDMIPSTSSLTVRPSRPSLLAILSLMTNYVDWIRLPWDLSLSLFILTLHFILHPTSMVLFFYHFIKIFIHYLFFFSSSISFSLSSFPSFSSFLSLSIFLEVIRTTTYHHPPPKTPHNPPSIPQPPQNLPPTNLSHPPKTHHP